MFMPFISFHICTREHEAFLCKQKDENKMYYVTSVYTESQK